MIRTPLHPVIFALLLAARMTAVDVRADDPFPQATADSADVSAEALQLLEAYAKSLVDRDAVVGAELHVIRNRQTILHSAWGWADRDQQRPLEVNSLYCVRSMTKPLTGTAIQMLIDEGALTLDRRVADLLPEFDQPDKRDVTVEHLLTHTSGLPMSAIGRPLTDYDSILDVARDAAMVDLQFPPGTDFQYSDAGCDTLGAIIEVVTQQPPEEFIAERILRPLRMSESLTLLDADDLPKHRIPNAYSGGSGNWEQHWSTDDGPIFPLFLASQSLYSTTTDYARFLELWMDGGVSRDRRLLSTAAVQRAQAPGRQFSDGGSGFQTLEATYGQHWVVYHDAGRKSPVVFGHSGSDGTHAWAWPDEDLMVLFCTQSRGMLVGSELETVIDELLIRGDLETHKAKMLARQTAEATLKPYEGIYWDEDAESAWYAVSIDKNTLVVERPGRFRSVATAQAEADTFTILGGQVTLTFEREGDSTPAMLMTSGSRTERQRRHEPDQTLPKMEVLADRTRLAHGTDAIKDAAVVKLSGTIRMGLLRSKGNIRHWFDARRSRTEVDLGPATMIIVNDGNQVAISPSGGPLELADGLVAEQEALSHPAIQCGDWNRVYSVLEPLRRIESETGALLLIRAKTQLSPNATIIADAETGMIVGEQRISYIPGVGFVGLDTTFADFRNVGSLKLPFQMTSKFANPFLGGVEIQYETAETNLNDAGLFDLPDE